MDRHPVTNREYKRFVDDGGYAREEFWREPISDGERTLSWSEAIARCTDAVGQRVQSRGGQRLLAIAPDGLSPVLRR